MTESLLDRALGRVQWWLQGHGNRRRPWVIVRLGNQISAFRYWRWERGATRTRP